MNSVSTVMKSALAKPSQNAVRAALSVIKFIGFAIHPNGARQKPFDPKPAEAPSRTLPRLRGRGDNAKPWRMGASPQCGGGLFGEYGRQSGPNLPIPRNYSCIFTEPILAASCASRIRESKR